MKFKGTLIGGATGFILTGNPYALALGAVAGYFFERDIIPGMKLSEKRKKFLDYLAVLIAGYNKAIYKDVKLWTSFLNSYKSYFELNEVECRYLINRFKSELDGISGTRLNETLKRLSGELLSPEEKELLAGVFLLFISGQRHHSTSMFKYVQKLAAWLEIHESQFDKLKKKWSFQSVKSYDVFGCTPLTSFEKIQKKYKRMIRKYHPDAVADPARKQQLERKAKELNSHWNHIRRYHDIIPVKNIEQEK